MTVFMYKIIQIIFIIFMINQCPAKVFFSFFEVQFLFTADQNLLWV